MFTVQAAVVLVTAALLKRLGGWVPEEVSLLQVSIALTLVCASILAAGRYSWLDKIGKVVVSVLALCTLAATIAVVPELDWGSTMPSQDQEFAMRDWLFVAALIGWMPSAIDVSVWQSLWTVAKAKDTGHRPSLRESMVDFHAGYVGTAILAICFLMLGAGAVHGQGAELQLRATEFPAQFVDLYAHTLGTWSRPLISVAAVLVMFSTSLTVIDGFPRALQELRRVWNTGDEGSPRGEVAADRTVYWGALVVLGMGSLLILGVAVSSLVTLIDLATVLSFLTAPLLSWLNHRSVTGDEVSADSRPQAWLVRASWAGIAVQASFALAYLALRFG
jgi:Mn2+/Fe2+ NRAMP family transporter